MKIYTITSTAAATQSIRGDVSGSVSCKPTSSVTSEPNWKSFSCVIFYPIPVILGILRIWRKQDENRLMYICRVHFGCGCGDVFVNRAMVSQHCVKVSRKKGKRASCMYVKGIVIYTRHFSANGPPSLQAQSAVWVFNRLHFCKDASILSVCSCGNQFF